MDYYLLLLLIDHRLANNHYGSLLTTTDLTILSPLWELTGWKSAAEEQKHLHHSPRRWYNDHWPHCTSSHFIAQDTKFLNQLQKIGSSSMFSPQMWNLPVGCVQFEAYPTQEQRRTASVLVLQHLHIFSEGRDNLEKLHWSSSADRRWKSQHFVRGHLTDMSQNSIESKHFCLCSLDFECPSVTSVSMRLHVQKNATFHNWGQTQAEWDHQNDRQGTTWYVPPRSSPAFPGPCEISVPATGTWTTNIGGAQDHRTDSTHHIFHFQANPIWVPRYRWHE